MAKEDFYEILGVARDAVEGDIKKAYRKIAFENHPDRNPDDQEAEARFKAAAEAYAALSDPEKRAQYDRFGHAGMGAGPGFGSVDDIFSSFGDIFEELFGFGGGGRGRGGRPRGSDIAVELNLTFEDAAAGSKEEIVYPRHTLCEPCKGSGADGPEGMIACVSCAGQGVVRHAQGFFSFSSACPRCQGAGKIIKTPCQSCEGAGVQEEERTLLVSVPAGVDSGSRIRIRGEGEVGPGGSMPGDLYVIIHLVDHPVFDRENEHLICRIPISYAQATLGAEIEVPTLEGSQRIHVSPGTQSGETFAIRGGGFPRIGRSSRGDEIVQVFVQVPKKVSKRQKELLREYAEIDGDSSTLDEDLLTRFKKKFSR